MSAIQFAYEAALCAREVSKKIEADFLVLCGWEKVRDEDGDVWWYNETDGASPQESAVLVALHFYKRNL